MIRIELKKLDGLRPHEQTRVLHRRALTRKIVKNRYVTPIVADRRSGTVLDGHHRLHVARELGLQRIPVIYVDYADASIVVQSRRKNLHVQKNDVVRRAFGRQLYLPKSTKHVFQGRHVSCLGAGVRVPVSELM
ncbi:ParB N-terminal domain-containing protein [Candidatus Micrarchaeota archaeon]|nr:ParB N-terminal domain-containing protein [Candidatus Micrarchaeota archaeon]